MTFEEFKSRIRLAGFRPSDEVLAEMWEALPGVEAMRARVRREYDYEDEPAHVYTMEPRR